VHFLRNALDYVPRRVDDDCLQELRWFYDRRELAEVRRDIAAWLAKWQAKYPKLCLSSLIPCGRGGRTSGIPAKS
jgi:putative transposase